MKKNKRIFAIAVLLLSCAVAGAQQDPMISQYMSNQLFFNPAYAGTHDYATVSGLYRKQWVNFDGAPETSFLSYDKRFTDRHIGLGFTLVNDKIGVSNQTELAGHYDYQIPIGKGFLSLGIKGALSYYTARVTNLTVWDKNDVVFANNIIDKWVPNFGAGAYYYVEDVFYAGFSVPHLLNYNKPSEFVSAELTSVPAYERHCYLSSGYVFKLSADVSLKPSVLVKYMGHAPIEGDLNLNVFFLNTFTVGASYRTDEGYVALFEIRAGKNIRIGYAYDWPQTKMDKYSNGTHEIMLSYDFIHDIYKMKSPRFF
jgi:type IX secretion system PorP/SprF family membrane protein